jgi:hypothetical protein
LIACGTCAQDAGSYIKPRSPFCQRRRRSTLGVARDEKPDCIVAIDCAK